MIMKEILEVSDDWNSVLRIVDTIQEGGMCERWSPFRIDRKSVV